MSGSAEHGNGRPYRTGRGSAATPACVRKGLSRLAGLLTVAGAAWLLLAPTAAPGAPAYAQALAIPDREIYVIRPDGSGLRRVTRNRYEEGDPVFSPDGTRIAFYRNRRPGFLSVRSDIWSANAQGGDRRLLIRGSGGSSVSSPRYSPDGTRIAYVERFPEELWVASTAGTERELWATGAVGRYAWTVDGTALIHSGASSGLTVENRTTRRSLRPPAGPIGSLDVAADGRIAFERGSHLWIAGADGRGAHRVLARGGRFSGIGSPAWAPDGKRVAFHWFRCPAKTEDIYTIRPDGTGLRRVTGRGTRGPWFTRLWSTSPRFSPDGRLIVFARERPFAEVPLCESP